MIRQIRQKTQLSCHFSPFMTSKGRVWRGDGPSLRPCGSRSMLSQNSFLTGQLSAPCWLVGAMTGGVDDILADGCFLPPSELERILRRLRNKKNLILQGPPGTGKTWLAKRLGMGLRYSRQNYRCAGLRLRQGLGGGGGRHPLRSPRLRCGVGAAGPSMLRALARVSPGRAGRSRAGGTAALLRASAISRRGSPVPRPSAGRDRKQTPQQSQRTRQPTDPPGQ